MKILFMLKFVKDQSSLFLKFFLDKRFGYVNNIRSQ